MRDTAKVPLTRPDTRFARSAGVSIAYQVIGDGPVDLVFMPGWLTSSDILWDSPAISAFLTGLSRFSRLILFDKRGLGMSDREVGNPTLEERAEDIRIVLDAVGSEKAVIAGLSEGANMSVMFAATYPERTHSLVLMSCRPCVSWRPDWPMGWRRNEFETYLDDLVTRWGEPLDIERLAPEIAHDPVERQFWSRMLTTSATPASAEKIARLWYEIDVREILPAIAVPALLIHREQELSVPVAEARIVADLIPNCDVLITPGRNHVPWLGDSQVIIDKIHSFVTSSPAPAREPDRVLRAILTTDIVDSSALNSQIGDQAWSSLVSEHFRTAEDRIAKYGGSLVKTMGDGILATFTGPLNAIAAGKAIREDAQSRKLKLRSGIHIGECLLRNNDVSGLAVNISARIMAYAGDNEILVSRTIKDLSFGSEQEFLPGRTVELKGIDGMWELYEIV